MKKVIIAMVSLFFVTLLLYIQNLGFDFVYDDIQQILANPWIKDPANILTILSSSVWGFAENVSETRFYRPMMHLVYMGEYHLFGFKPWGWHLVNLLIHSTNAVLVFLVASRLFGAKKGLSIERVGGLFAGALFAFHTINVEAVSWVAAVPDLTYTLFVLCSFYLFICASSVWSVKYILSISIFYIALLCKEPAMALVLLIPAYEYSLSGKFGWGFLRRYTPFVIIAIIYFIIRASIVGTPLEEQEIYLAPYQGFINIFPLFARYIYTLILPTDLSVIYKFVPYTSLLNPMVLGSAALTALIIGVIFFYRKNTRIFTAAIIIITPILPVLYAPVVSKGGFADRYLYLPSAGYAILLSYILIKSYKALHTTSYRHLISGAAILLLILHGAGTLSRSVIWHDNISLWEDALQKNPSNYTARYNLAIELQYGGKVKESITHYIEAIKILQITKKTNTDLAAQYQSRGEKEAATAYYMEAKRVNIPLSNSIYNLAMAYEELGDNARAVFHYRESIKITPSSPDAHFNLAMIYFKDGLIEKGKKEIAIINKIDPLYVKAQLSQTPAR